MIGTKSWEVYLEKKKKWRKSYYKSCVSVWQEAGRQKQTNAFYS